MSEFTNLWIRGLAAFHSGDENGAISIFSLIHESDARIAFNLANIYIGQKNYSQALTCLNKAFELNQSMPVLYFQRAYVRYQQGKFDSAYKNYLKTVVLLGGQAYLNCRSMGLDLTLYEKEIKMNMAVSVQAKESLANNKLNESFRLFVIPAGLFFQPLIFNDEKNRNVQSLKIRTDMENGKRRLPKSPLSSAIEKESNDYNFLITPMSLGKIRIKIFIDLHNAIVIMADRLISLGDLSLQIGLKLNINQTPLICANDSGIEIRSDQQLHEYLKDTLCFQFKFKLGAV